MQTVLVIDDTQDSFDLVADALEGAFALVHGGTGPEGLALARAHQPNLILLDMSLPGMDGWAVVRHLKADANLAHVPVIAMTAHAMNGDRERCIAAGCDDYVSKPIDVRSLAALVTRHAEQEPARTAQRA